MPHEPKLTVYTIKLNPTDSCQPKSNKWLFRNKINEANTTPLEDGYIMGEIFRKFINALDTPKMYAEEASKKCMTANQADIEEPDTNTNIFLHSESFIIEGKVEGGSYGRKRNKTSTSNKADKTDVGEDDAITEDFYFLLYSPLKSMKSILMVQSYSDDSIDSVMKKFWQNFFTFPSKFNKPDIKRFVPQSIIDDFKSNATVSSFTFSTDIPGETLLDNITTDHQRNFKVTIKITPTSDDLAVNEFDQMLEPLKHTLFTKHLNLGQFFSKKGDLKNTVTKKTSQFDLGSDFEIQPTILLSKYIEINGNEDFDKIRDYCFDLLESVKAEIYNQHAIQER